jgi:hypothetical protein
MGTLDEIQHLSDGKFHLLGDDLLRHHNNFLDLPIVLCIHPSRTRYVASVSAGDSSNKCPFTRTEGIAIQGSGWVVKSLEASLWAFHAAGTFEEAVLRAVNLGDDADTSGAICGQLAGAY